MNPAAAAREVAEALGKQARSGGLSSTGEHISMLFALQDAFQDFARLLEAGSETVTVYGYREVGSPNQLGWYPMPKEEALAAVKILNNWANRPLNKEYEAVMRIETRWADGTRLVPEWQVIES